MMHDSKYFSEPEEFKPERFRQKIAELQGNNLQVLSRLDKDDPSAVIFGFGRRYATNHIVLTTHYSLKFE